MKKYLFVIFVILLLFLGFGIYKIKQKKKVLSSIPPPPIYPYVVKVEKVQAGTLKGYALYRGFYEPLKKGFLAPKVGGVVKELRVWEGDNFKKGDILAVIDPYELKAKLEALSAKREALLAKLEALKIVYETQKRIYERDKKLFKRGGVSKERLQLSKAKFTEVKAKLKGVEAELKGVETRINILQHNLKNYTYLRAPYDGVVRRVLIREGNFVPPGRPILELEGKGSYRVLVEIPRDAKVGREAIVKANGKEFKAEVGKIFPSSQKDLKVVEVLVGKLPVPSDTWVNVKLETKECKGFIVPFSAILYLEGGTFVVDTKKNLLPVDIKVVSGEKACVRGNLKGKKVIVAGQFRLRQIALHKWPINVEE